MMGKNKVTLGDLYPLLGLLGGQEKLESLRSRTISGIANSEQASEAELVFIASENYLKGIEASKASIFIVAASLAPLVNSELHSKKQILFSADAMLAMANSSALFSTEALVPVGINPSAIVHASVKMGNNVRIAPGVVIEADAIIGDECVLHARAYVGPRTKLGAQCVLFPGVVIYQDAVLGNGVRVHANTVIGADGFGYVQERSARGVRHVKLHHLGRVVIGNDVEIGASSSIDRGTVGDTVIGNGVIIDNQVQIGHNCQIGDGVIICGSTGIAGSVKVGAFALIAGFVGVGNGADIGAGAQIAGYTMVFGKVPAGVKWGGVPGRPLKENMRLQAMLSRLPEIYDDWKKRKKEV